MAASPALADAARFVWGSRAPSARALRLALLPLSGLYRVAVASRNAAYSVGLLPSRRLPLPSVGIGNLSVGGTGKTPLTIFVAQEMIRRGLKPGIILRGYGGDELIEHRAAVPDALVEADADRHAAAARAKAAGAQVLVLDDCLQRRDVVVDAMLVLVSADTWSWIRWPLPAGPWREGLRAVRRAQLLVMTRKLADQVATRRLGEQLSHRTGVRNATAHLALGALESLNGGEPVPAGSLRGKVVTAVCGVGEPDLFAGQLERAGAWVDLVAFPDHHAFSADAVAELAREARRRDRLVVTTVKDAVKLLDLWPADGPPCYVARLDVRITAGAEELSQVLDAVAATARRKLQASEQ